MYASSHRQLPPRPIHHPIFNARTAICHLTLFRKCASISSRLTTLRMCGGSMLEHARIAASVLLGFGSGGGLSTILDIAPALVGIMFNSVVQYAQRKKLASMMSSKRPCMCLCMARANVATQPSILHFVLMALCCLSSFLLIRDRVDKICSFYLSCRL